MWMEAVKIIHFSLFFGFFCILNLNFHCRVSGRVEFFWVLSRSADYRMRGWGKVVFLILLLK